MDDYLSGDLADVFRQAFNQVASNPPEILLLVAAVLLIGGLLVYRRV
jgi:hypothetical protein